MLNERQWEIMNKKQKNAKHKKPNLKKGLYELSERYKNADKSSLISAMTGGVFVLLALIQLFFVLSTPIAQTFDHVSLILVDFIIAALCFVYVLYRRGSLGDGFGFLHTDCEEKAAENIPQATSKAAKTAKAAEPTRICIPDNAARRLPSTREAQSSQKRRSYIAENENLFSPRHFYSKDV